LKLLSIDGAFVSQADQGKALYIIRNLPAAWINEKGTFNKQKFLFVAKEY
jgi:hypothetical protein